METTTALRSSSYAARASRQVGRLVQAGGQGERVLHGQLGAGADGEVRGVGGVAEQHDVVVEPALVADRGEADPARVVRQDLVPVEHMREELAHGRDGGLVGLTRGEVLRRDRVEPRSAPHVVMHLDDEGAAVGVEGVAVHLHDAMRRLEDVEGERLEDLVGAEPHVAATPHVERGLEVVGVLGAHERVEAVRRDHEVVVGGELLDIRGSRPEPDVDPEVRTPTLEDLEQSLAAQRREAVPAAGDDLTLVVDVDVVPARELSLHLVVDDRVGVCDPAERLVGEDDAETEGVVGSVALPHADLVIRPELLGESGEVEPARSTTDDCDPHCAPPGASWPRPASILFA